MQTTRLLHRHKTELMMVALVAEIVFSPYTDLHPEVGGLSALLALVLMLTIFGYTAPRWLLRYILAPLASVWVVARFLEAFGVEPLWFAQVASAVGLALSLSLLWIMLHRFSIAPQKEGSVIAEAFITYLVIAISFSQLYEIVDRTTMHAFNKVISAPRGSTLIYFSMVTLSSVGTGEIAPVNPYLKVAAAFESIVGVFYIAVVVARLVSSIGRQPQVGAK